MAIGQTLVPRHMRREAFGSQSAYGAAIAAGGPPPAEQQQQIRAPGSMVEAAASLGAHPLLQDPSCISSCLHRWMTMRHARQHVPAHALLHGAACLSLACTSACMSLLTCNFCSHSWRYILPTCFSGARGSGGSEEPSYGLPCAAAGAPLPQASREEIAQLERAGEVQEAGKRVTEARSKARVEDMFLRQEVAAGGTGAGKVDGYERDAVASSSKGAD